MNSLCQCDYFTRSYIYSQQQPLFQSKSSQLLCCYTRKSQLRIITLRATGNDNGEEGKKGRTFLSMEEAGLVEISGLSIHERFLCRLTISSLNLLRVIAEQERCEIEELNAGRVCDWFLKDKLKREQDIGSAVLQWDDDDDDGGFSFQL